MFLYFANDHVTVKKVGINGAIYSLHSALNLAFLHVSSVQPIKVIIDGKCMVSSLSASNEWSNSIEVFLRGGLMNDVLFLIHLWVMLFRTEILKYNMMYLILLLIKMEPSARKTPRFFSSASRGTEVRFYSFRKGWLKM